jgi:hypothetical protein
MPIQRNGHEPAGCFFDSTEREKERRRMGGGGHLRRRSRFRASHPRLVQSNLTHSMRQKIVSRTDDLGRAGALLTSPRTPLLRAFSLKLVAHLGRCL